MGNILNLNTSTHPCLMFPIDIEREYANRPYKLAWLNSFVNDAVLGK